MCENEFRQNRFSTYKSLGINPNFLHYQKSECLNIFLPSFWDVCFNDVWVNHGKIKFALAIVQHRWLV